MMREHDEWDKKIKIVMAPYDRERADRLIDALIDLCLDDELNGESAQFSSPSERRGGSLAPDPDPDAGLDE